MAKRFPLLMAILVLAVGIGVSLLFRRADCAGSADAVGTNKLRSPEGSLVARPQLSLAPGTVADAEGEKRLSHLTSERSARRVTSYPLLEKRPAAVKLDDTYSSSMSRGAESQSLSLPIEELVQPVPVWPTPTSSAETAAGDMEGSDWMERGRVHVVSAGETLAGIAIQYLGSAQEAMRIVAANPNLRTAKSSLLVGSQIIIPPRSKQPDGNLKLTPIQRSGILERTALPRIAEEP